MEMIISLAVTNRLESLSVDGVTVVNSGMNLLPTLPNTGKLTDSEVVAGNPDMIIDPVTKELRRVTDDDILDNAYVGM